MDSNWLTFYNETDVRKIYGMERLFATQVRKIYIIERTMDRLSQRRKSKLRNSTEGNVLWLAEIFTRDRLVSCFLSRSSFHQAKSNNITTKLYDKRDAFGFHIVNFPFMLSNIPSAPAYGVYASQLICYARFWSNYSDFYYATGT